MSEPVQRESMWRRWLVRPIVAQLSQGTDPGKIAKAVAFGITLGLFPLLGLPTLVSLAVGIPMKLNQPILQAFREITYPLHLATILLFIRAGEFLFRADHVPLSIPLMMERFYASPTKFMAEFGMLGLYGVTAWALLAPLLAGSIYIVAKPLISRVSKHLTRPRYAA